MEHLLGSFSASRPNVPCVYLNAGNGISISKLRYEVCLVYVLDITVVQRAQASMQSGKYAIGTNSLDILGQGWVLEYSSE